MKRSRRLERRTALTAKSELRRRTPVREVSLNHATPSGKRTRRRDTGPDRATRNLVLERDDWRCFCCGTPVIGRTYSLQHRLARRLGGTTDPLINSPANLIVLLGSATTGCHYRVEQRYAADRVAGYWLRTGDEPADTSVVHWWFGAVLLGHDGSVKPLREAA